MCLGASARAANENARRRYAYENERRERQWMQTMSIYQAQKIKYIEDASNLGLAQAAAVNQMEAKMDEDRARAQLKYRELYEKLQKNSSYSKLLAAGRTGKSVKRIGTMDFAKYGRDISAVAKKLVFNDAELSRQSQESIAKYKAAKDQAFTKVAFQPIPDVAPPQPVMQSVGAAAFMDALSIGSKVAGIYGAF